MSPSPQKNSGATLHFLCFDSVGESKQVCDVILTDTFPFMVIGLTLGRSPAAPSPFVCARLFRRLELETTNMMKTVNIQLQSPPSAAGLKVAPYISS